MNWIKVALFVAVVLALSAQPANATRLSDNSLASPEHRVNCHAQCGSAVVVRIRPE